MLKKKLLLLAAASLSLGLCATSAFADDCSGRDHTGSTILGGVLGAASLAARSPTAMPAAWSAAPSWAGLAGNAVGRDVDLQ